MSAVIRSKEARRRAVYVAQILGVVGAYYLSGRLGLTRQVVVDGAVVTPLWPPTGISLAALLYLGGAYSHGIRKGPILRQGESPTEALYAPENIGPREPQAAERAVGDRVAELLAERFGGPLAYARVDLLGGSEPLVLEVELTEPSLFLAHGEGSAQRLAQELTRRASRASSAARP